MPENFVTFIATHQWVIILAAVWTIPWKGVALWRAARNKSASWFVILLIVNTLGILDIIYIFAFSKRKDTPAPVEPPKTQEAEKVVLDVKAEEVKSEIELPEVQIPKKDAAISIQTEEAKVDIDDEAPKS